METGGLRCREKQITDLTTGGAKETRQKKEKILDLSYLCWWSRKLWFKKQSRQLLGDGKLNDIIGWKKLTTIEVSMLLLSGTMVKNLSIFFVAPATEAEFVWENYTKIVEDRFFSSHLWRHFFWQKNKWRHATTSLWEDTILILEKSWTVNKIEWLIQA